MLYLIDSANAQEIHSALALGMCGITANPSMYRKQQLSLTSFVKTYANQGLAFLSAEVIGTYEKMLTQARHLHALDASIVIKINFSKDGLRLVKQLSQEKIKTAMTLVFSLSQAVAAINAGCDYLFFFIGRNEEAGYDGLAILQKVQAMIVAKHYAVKTVAASIKNLYQVERLAALGVDYAAIPYTLYEASLYHPLSEAGAKSFEEDYRSLVE